MVHEGWHWCYVADPYKGVSEGYCYFDNDDNTIQVSYMGKRFWIQYVVTRKDGKVYYYGGQSSSGEIWVVSPKNQ